jgi:hypothetical protein
MRPSSITFGGTGGKKKTCRDPCAWPAMDITNEVSKMNILLDIGEFYELRVYLIV